MEEIFVTAQKREERIQDVPISISALTSNEINERGLVSGEDYLRGLPGVNFVEGGAGIIIRGIETNPAGAAANGRAVSTYFGETSTTGSQGGVDTNDIKLVDVERVEVLRGPQGTSFGDSALGGAVRIIPVAPRLDRVEGKVAANYSVTSGTGGENQMMQAVVNVPLLQDRLAIRASAYRFEDSGYYQNVAGSNADFQAYAAQFGAQSSAIDEREVGGTQFIGGRISALFQATEQLKFTLLYLRQESERDQRAYYGTEGSASLARVTLGPYEQAFWQVAPQHAERGWRWGVDDSKIHLANLTAEYDFGWSSLLTTVSHIESWGVNSADVQFDQPISGRNDHHVRQHLKGEMRLATQLSGSWNFLAGVYGEKMDRDTFFDAYWFGSQATNRFGPTSFLGSVGATGELTQKAAFAEASWKFLPRFTLTGGARFFEYDRETDQLNAGALFGDRSSFVSGGTSGDSFKANVTYKPTDNAMIYAAWSQGFRLGVGPQAGLSPALCDRNSDGIVDGTNGVTIASTQFIEPDSLDNYELGTKFSLLDRRLEITADVYRIEWEGLPFLTRAPSAAEGGCGVNYFTNVGGSTSEGVELQANIHATDALRIDVGGSWIDAELTQDVPAQGYRSGDELPGAPEYTANLALHYEFALGEYEAFVRADSIYMGRFYSRFAQNSLTETAGYVKVDLSANVEFNNLGVKLFVHNLTDADEFTIRTTPGGGYRLRPRTVGLQLDYNF